jgi:plastocyanin
MSEIHPDWHTLEEDEMLVSVRAVNEPKAEKEKAPAKKRVHTTTVSRRPAAVFGILMVMGTTTLFYQGVQNLTGQLSEGSLEVQITEEGLNPPIIAANAGEQITWVNQRQVPQYIISDTLCSTSGECLNTPTMFQGDSASYTIPQDTADGTYSYFSPTDPNLTGTITVGAGGAPPVQNSDIGLPDLGENNTIDAFSLAEQTLLQSIQQQLELDQGTLEQETIPEEETPAPVANVSGIPQNPYKIGSNRNPIPRSEFEFDDLPPQDITPLPEPILSGGAQKPFSQPETGGAVWIVLLSSLIGIWMLTRRSLKAYR